MPNYFRPTLPLWILGCSLLSVIFGANTRVIPPLDVAHSNTEHHRLVVRFDEDGKVVDYTYDRTETPSTRVY